MRQITKAVCGALLAVLACGALTAGSASAATCKKGSSEAEHKTLCVEGQQVGSPTEKVITTAAFTQKAGTTAVLEVPQQEWAVTCSNFKTSETPAIESGGELSVKLTKFKLHFEGCKVQLGTKTCTVSAFNTLGLTGSLVAPENLRFVGGLNSNFLEFTLAGCILSGLYEVAGADECTIKQAEVEAVAKELACEVKGSELELTHGRGGPVKLLLTGNLELAGTSKGKKFSITK